MPEMYLELLKQGGMTAVVGFIAYKAIYKLYTDMREDSKNREDKLMNHLDKVSDTLDKIDMRMEKMDGRICSLEEYCKEVRKGVNYGQD